MKILIISPNKWKSHNRHYEYFKFEIAEQHDVRIFGYQYSGWMTESWDKPNVKLRHIDDITDWLSFKPDVVMTHMAKYNMTLEGLCGCKLPTIHWVPDYVPLYRTKQARTLWIGRHEDKFIREHRPELVLCPNLLQVDEIEKQHPYTKVEHFPFSVDSNIFKYDGRKRNINVAAAMSTVPRFYKNRTDMVEEVGKMPQSFSLGGEGKWKDRICNEDYVGLLSQSKIVVNATSLNHTDFRPLNPRFFEIPSCGAMLLTEPADDMKLLGFVPGKNCETFESIDEMKSKIAWYLKYEDNRREVAARGQRLVHKYHTSEKRVEQLTELIRDTFRERIS